jgi:hypothetical protein
MIRKYAFLKNNTVLLIDNIDEVEYVNHIREWDSIIDITDSLPEPRTGWILDGNILVPVSPDEQQRTQQAFGSALALELVNRMGARNLQLASQGTPVNVAALLSSVGGIKSLIETGALKTARSILIVSAPNFPDHADIFNYGSSQITSFLQSKGWD